MKKVLVSICLVLLASTFALAESSELEGVTAGVDGYTTYEDWAGPFIPVKKTVEYSSGGIYIELTDGGWIWVKDNNNWLGDWNTKFTVWICSRPQIYIKFDANHKLLGYQELPPN